jgi:transcriptional regulator with XRE-family HTH domain
MAAADGVESAIELRRWRRDAGITRQAAAADLGISERMLAYYEAGGHLVPRAILLAARALAAGLDHAPGGADARERWVGLVRTVLEYGRGAPVVGRMLRDRDHRSLADFLAFVKKGPDPALALTDPALFKSLRSAVTAAQLAGLARFRLDRRHVARGVDKTALARGEKGGGQLDPISVAANFEGTEPGAALPK